MIVIKKAVPYFSVQAEKSSRDFIFFDSDAFFSSNQNFVDSIKHHIFSKCAEGVVLKEISRYTGNSVPMSIKYNTPPNVFIDALFSLANSETGYFETHDERIILVVSPIVELAVIEAQENRNNELCSALSSINCLIAESAADFSDYVKENHAKEWSEILVSS